MTIEENAELSSLDGLESLNSLNGYLRIADNPQLTSIDGLESLDYLTITFVFIENNPQLAVCEIPVICEFMANDGGGNVFGNALRCQNKLQINAACGNCYLDELNITSQAQIDDFAVAFSSCDVINGSVRITGNDIHDLSGLSTIKTIEGRLYIHDNPQLETLGGFDELESIGWYLRIKENPSMETISGFSNLNSIGGYLRIEENDILSSLEGFSSLSNIDDHVLIEFNPQLTDLNGLGALTTVGDYFRITDNSMLNSLQGLESLNSIGGFLLVVRNDNLADFSSLSSLSTIGGNLLIKDNESLEVLEGFESLSNLGGYLSIARNISLTDIGNFGMLETIPGHLIVAECSELSSLDGLESINHVGGKLLLELNESLNDITALEALNTVEDSILILDNNILASLSGIDNIGFGTFSGIKIERNPLLSECEVESVCDYINFNPGLASIMDNAIGCNNEGEILSACDECYEGDVILTNQIEVDEFIFNYSRCIQGDLTISGNDITNLLGLELLTIVTGNVKIIINPLLENLTGLELLQHVGESLQIRNNDVLDDLSGLDALPSIGAYLWIENNTMLTSLNGLEGILEIGSYMLIRNNDVLSSLSGIDNIDHASIEYMSIQHNPLLVVCEVNSVCEFLANNGTANISNNAPGCNSKDEVETACLTGTEDLIAENTISIFPNPANDEITISNDSGFAIETIRMYNQLGQVVFQKAFQNNTFDISALANGIYIVELKTDIGRVFKKLMVE